MDKLNVIQKIAKARAQFEDIKKDVNGHGYKYADLDGIMKAIKQGIIDNGLHIYHTFKPIELGGAPYLETTCHVADGETELTSSIPLPLAGVSSGRNPAQEMGKILTYGRRYSLSAVLCITADEDTDAQSPEQLSKRNAQSESKTAKKSDVVEKPAEQSQKVKDAVAKIEKVTALKIAEKRFVASEQAWKWLDLLLDQYQLSEDARIPIRGSAVGKTPLELEELAKNSAMGVTYEADLSELSNLDTEIIVRKNV